MRSILIVALLVGAPMVEAMMPPSYFETCSEYGTGWKHGWIDGWKHVKGKHALTPMVPMPPMPPFGKNTSQDGYQDGFVAGREAALRD